MKDYASHTKMIVFESLKKAEDKLVSFLDSYFEVSALNYTDDGKEEYVGYVDGAFDALDTAKQDKLTSTNVTTSGTNGTGAVVTAVTANDGAVTVTKSNVQIPVGSASATTYASIWLQ